MLLPNWASGGNKSEFRAAPSGQPLSAEMLQKQALHTLGENAAAVLHELRGPLQAIRAHVQLLERKTTGSADATAARHFPPIYQGLDHMNALLDQFLCLSRLSEASLTRLDMAACLEEILPLLRSMAIMRNIELIREFQPGLPPCFGDEQQLKRLVLNLFVNACDAITALPEQTVKRPGRIRLALKGEADAILLTVADNGCGMSPEKLERIWTPFYTDKTGGTGLGLPGCLTIAEEHGGNLAVSSELGEGSSFILRLPLPEK